jgi:HTH-type transcriptional regulator/antitoxin HigA
MADAKETFSPDWISHPGDTILDLLEERDWSQADFATRMGYTTKHISQLLTGKVPITLDAALKLERVLGGTVRFWLNREAQYRESLIRIKESEKLKEWTNWLDELPVKNLMDSNIIDKNRLTENNKPKTVNNMLRFFGVASPEEWRTHYKDMAVAFRSASKEHNIGAVSAWLRLGEIETEKDSMPKYDAAKFKKALYQIRNLTLKSPEEFIPEMKDLCRKAGVSFILVPSIPRAHVSGATRWLNPHKPIIQMSLYGKANDKFWFTFFHESAHLLKHDKKTVFLDELLSLNYGDSKEEIEANEWVRNFLIPSKFVHQLPKIKNSKKEVSEFASKIGIHPGIVVGRLQHDGLIDQSWMNDLKEYYDFSLK